MIESILGLALLVVFGVLMLILFVGGIVHMLARDRKRIDACARNHKPPTT
jgi:hypothetical protein